MIDELVNDLAGQVNRNRETDSRELTLGCVGNNRRVDANDLPPQIY